MEYKYVEEMMGEKFKIDEEYMKEINKDVKLNKKG